MFNNLHGHAARGSCPEQIKFTRTVATYTPVEGGCEVGIGGAEDEFACPGVNDVPQGGTEL